MKQASRITVSALANAISLATGIVHEIDGRKDSLTINGNKATREAVSRLVASRIQSNLFTQKKVA